jgi:TetR/AcrR family transcriptional regulator, lmrAB and yxaGH operons repressor
VSETRARMIESAVDSLRRRGVCGMSFTEVLQESGAARGAIYHHFPGGKSQLVGEAAASNAQDVREILSQLPDGSPRDVVEAFLAMIRPVVEQSAGGSGCAIAAVAMGTGTADTDLREIAAGAFTAWRRELAGKLTTAGMAADQASALAATLITLLEGAHVLCRAAGDLEPFDQAATIMMSLVMA